MLPPAWQTVTAAFATNAAAAMHYKRGLFSRPVPSSPLPSRFHSVTTDPAPPHFCTIPLTVDNIQTRYREHFCRAMRMPVNALVDLVDSLRSRLPRCELSPSCRMAIALRYLGGGSYLDVCAAFGVHPSAMFRAFWEVVDAVTTTPSLAFDFRLGNRQRRLDYAGGFQSRRNSPFGNVVGALDGVAIEQEQPLASDVQCFADYYSREGFYALTTQAICDSDFRFRWMSCLSPGFSHDSSAFACTELGRALLDPTNVLTRAMTEDGHRIVADEAYAASKVLAVPWPGCGCSDRWTDSYNIHLFSCRIHIEQAFGMLSWRWGVFWRPRCVPFPQRPSLVRACFRLQKFCRGHENARDCFTSPYGTDRVGGVVSLAPNDSVSADQRGRRRDRERFHIRVSMTARVESLGVLRPGVAPRF